VPLARRRFASAAIRIWNTDQRFARLAGASRIVFLDNNYLLRDLKSKNGTLVNGAAVSTHALMEGDQIRSAKRNCVFDAVTPESKPVGGGAAADGFGGARAAAGGPGAGAGTAGMTRSGGGETFEDRALRASGDFARAGKGEMTRRAA